MLLIFLLVSFFHILYAQNSATQCEIRYFLKDNIICEDCLDFCLKLNTLTPDQKLYCNPFCTKKTSLKPTTIISTTEALSTTYYVSTSVNKSSTTLLTLLCIPVILVIIAVVLCCVFQEKLKHKCCPGTNRNPDGKTHSPGSSPGNPNSPTMAPIYYHRDKSHSIDSSPGDANSQTMTPIVNSKDPFSDTPHAPGFNNPLLTRDGQPSGSPGYDIRPEPEHEDSHLVSPYLESLPPASIAPARYLDDESLLSDSYDPKPIPGGFTMTHKPELVQSIMMSTRLEEAPSEIIQGPKKRQSLHFDLTKNTTESISATSTENYSYPSQETSDDGRQERLESLDEGQKDSLSSSSPGYANSKSINPYDRRNPPTMKRDLSCESATAVILPSMDQQRSFEPPSLEPVSMDNPVDDPFSTLLNPPGVSESKEPANDLQTATALPFGDLLIAPPASTMERKLFF